MHYFIWKFHFQSLELTNKHTYALLFTTTLTNGHFVCSTLFWIFSLPYFVCSISWITDLVCHVHTHTRQLRVFLYVYIFSSSVAHKCSIWNYTQFVLLSTFLHAIVKEADDLAARLWYVCVIDLLYLRIKCELNCRVFWHKIRERESYFIVPRGDDNELILLFCRFCLLLSIDICIGGSVHCILKGLQIRREREREIERGEMRSFRWFDQ